MTGIPGVPVMRFRTQFRNFIRQAASDQLESLHKVPNRRAWRAARRTSDAQIDELCAAKGLPIDEQDEGLTGGIADWEIWKRAKQFYLDHKEVIDAIVKILVQALLGMLFMQGVLAESSIATMGPPAAITTGAPPPALPEPAASPPPVLPEPAASPPEGDRAG